MLHAVMKPNAKMFVVNNLNRVIPTKENIWFDDGIDIQALLDEYFQQNMLEN